MSHSGRIGFRSAQVAIGVVSALAITGLVLGWSNRFAWYDEVIHTLSGLAVTLAAGLWLSSRILRDVSQWRATYVLMLAAIGLGVGAVWEIAEFAYDQLNGAPDSIRGKVDTISDLVCDWVGAVGGGYWMARLHR